MDPATTARLAANAAVFKALAHPTRLFIVEQLAVGERCVNDLTAMVGADVSTISKHLSVLKNAGIIADEKRGLQVFYRLLTPCVLSIFSCCDGVLSSRRRQLEAAAR